ncbi:hypothetical protein BK142_07690 [Paenibacillus glucanolyticus]|nr:hypothetical protein BK142_07690 [Paenibacillus glucanolyticus]
MKKLADSCGQSHVDSMREPRTRSGLTGFVDLALHDVPDNEAVVTNLNLKLPGSFLHKTPDVRYQLLIGLQRDPRPWRQEALSMEYRCELIHLY